MASSWEPATIILGEMPLQAGEQKAYAVPTPNRLGARVDKVLVYAFITVHDAEGFYRGYYTVSTKRQDGTAEYTYYMNVASVTDTVINSGNFWLPFGDGIEPFVYVTLSGAQGSLKPKKKPVKSCAGKDGATALKEYASTCPEDTEEHVGQVFATGFNWVEVLPPK